VTFDSYLEEPAAPVDVRKVLDSGAILFPYKVAKALEANTFRNVEFDNWIENQRGKPLKFPFPKHKLGNYFFNLHDFNFLGAYAYLLHTTSSCTATNNYSCKYIHSFMYIYFVLDLLHEVTFICIFTYSFVPIHLHGSLTNLLAQFNSTLTETEHNKIIPAIGK